jgi:hypothetical protein
MEIWGPECYMVNGVPVRAPILWYSAAFRLLVRVRLRWRAHQQLGAGRSLVLSGLSFEAMGFMSWTCFAAIALAVLGATEGTPFEGMIRGSGLFVGLVRGFLGKRLLC